MNKGKQQQAVRRRANLLLYFLFCFFGALSFHGNVDYMDAIRYLRDLENEAQVIEYLKNRDVNSPVDTEGNTIVHVAAKAQDHKAYEILLSLAACRTSRPDFAI